jgi:group I intron endonuclease
MNEKMKTGIYCWRNLVNDKIYIGSASVYFADRKKSHLYKLRHNVHPNKHLQSSWNEYGENNFIFEILEECEPDKCVEREQYWIDTLQATNKELGYNLRAEASSNLGFKHSEETKKQMSISHTDIVFSDEHCYNSGKAKRGENNTLHKLTEKDVLDIVKILVSGEKVYKIAKDYNVASSTICKIRDGQRWQWLTGFEIKVSKGGKSKLTENIVKEITELLNNKETTVSIAKKFNISQSTVSSIKLGKAWSHVSEINPQSRSK